MTTSADTAIGTRSSIARACIGLMGAAAFSVAAAAEPYIPRTDGAVLLRVAADGDDAMRGLRRRLQSDPGDAITAAGLARRYLRRNRATGDPRYLEHMGQQVWSKMNGDVLKQVATTTGGAYIPAGTKQVDMAAVYHDYVASVEQTDFETAKINSYIPRFQWFAAIALVLIVVDSFLTIGRERANFASEAAPCYT